MLSLLALSGLLAWTPPPNPTATNTSEATTKDTSASRRAGTQLMVIGAGFFGATYGVSTLVAAVQMDNPDHARVFEANAALAVPLFGPLIAATRTHNEDKRVGLAFSATGQLLGLGMVAAGAAITASAAHKGHPAPQRTRDLNLGAVIGGGAVGALTYLVTASIAKGSAGGISLGRRRMLIPLVGGFMAMPHSERYVQMWARGASSAIQLASAAAVVGGAIGLHRDRVRKRQASLAVIPTRDGPRITFAMRF